MKYGTIKDGQLISRAALILCVTLLSGCTYFGDRVQREIDKLNWQIPESVKPIPPEPEEPSVITSTFLWEPLENSVRLVIPVPHWQLGICTTSPSVHHDKGLYGLDTSRGRAVAGGQEYILQGSGDTWRNNALAIDPAGGGVLVIFVNSNDLQANGYRTAHWHVRDGRIKQVGGNQL